MLAKNHMPFAAACWTVTATAMHVPLAPALLGLAVATVSGLAPDLDTPGSTLGRKLPFISYPLGAVLGHRGLTHSLIACVACVFGIGWVATKAGAADTSWLTLGITAPFIVGYLSHVLADMLNPMGVPFFWPSQRAVRAPITWSCGSLIERIVAWGCLMGAVAWAAPRWISALAR